MSEQEEVIRMSYPLLLKHSYAIQGGLSGLQPRTRLAFLSQYVFSFTTYDDEKDDLFGRKAVEVCAAINDRKTFEYIKDADNYTWFLLMCNMPFFAERLEWGTSIRGAWWSAGEDLELYSCGLWVGDEQLTELKFSNGDEWGLFIAAVIEFATGEALNNEVLA